MKKTLNGSREDFALSHVPAFGLRPAVRCFAQVGSSSPLLCGDIATWRRRGNWWFEDQYFCDAHRAESDVSIVGELVVRRVRIACDVLMAGVSMSPPICQGEAMGRLEAAVWSIGGVLDVSRVLSTVGRYPAQPPQGGILHPVDDVL